MAEFGSHDEYVAEIARRIGPLEAPPEAVTELALQLDGLSKVEVAGEPEPGVPFQYLNRRFRWVIADDDLKALDALTQAATAAAGANFFFHQAPTVPAIVGLMVAAVKLFRQAGKKGAHISPLELRLLILLKNNAPRGLGTDEVLEIANRTSPVERGELEGALGRLEKLAVDDGTVKGFIAKDGAGRWHAAGF